MAALSRDGHMGSFLTELAQDEDLDDETKGTLRELAEDNTFLLAVEDYLQRTDRLHEVRAGETFRFPQTLPPSRTDDRYAMGDRGFEPRTSALSERRSNQLS